jgi:large subunit ribosomal protein L22
VADLVRNRTIAEATDILAFSPTRSARVIAKVLASAVANAGDLARNEKWHDGGDLDEDRLFVKRICVDEGVRAKRIRPRARGMAYRVLRRHCHITVEVDDRRT